jgi:hypothetical protein
MTAAGWVFMGISWGAIIALCGFCFARMLRGR